MLSDKSTQNGINELNKENNISYDIHDAVLDYGLKELVAFTAMRKPKRSRITQQALMFEHCMDNAQNVLTSSYITEFATILKYIDTYQTVFN